MPALPTNTTNLLRALSDFWTLFVRDQEMLRAYAEGLGLNVAQLYQRFLETVLGGQLKDAPLFQRVFYAPYQLREDAVVFVEGADARADRYEIRVNENLQDGEYLTNQVLLPTRFLVAGREFTVRAGTFSFTNDPFNSSLLTGYPVRVVQASTPAVWTSPLGLILADDIRPGDIFQIQAGGLRVRARIQGNNGISYYLAESPATFAQSWERRTHTVRALRVPYDTQQRGIPLEHPSYTARLTSAHADGVVHTASAKIDLTGNPAYQGAWASSTAYEQGDIVDRSGGLYSALESHTSGLSFDADLWDNLQTGYVYVAHAADPRVDGLYGLTSSGASGVLRTLSPISFSVSSIGGDVLLYRVRYAAGGTASYKTISLPHANIEQVTLQGRRLAPRTIVSETGEETVYPANGALLPGVDYLCDSDSGVLTLLSAWDAAFPSQATYQWLLEQARQTFTWRGNYTNWTTYAIGDVVRYDGKSYVSRTTHTSDGTVDALRYREYAPPFSFDVTRSVREIQVWLTDALLDEHTLYRNFGAARATPRASSELYRALLQASAQLYWAGLTAARLKSVLNAIMEFPLIREDGEVLAAYHNGLTASGAGARTYGYATGTDGIIDAGLSTFAAASANFLSTDVGATLRVVTASGTVRTYTIVNRNSATEVTISPLPSADAANLGWSYLHPVGQNRVEVSPGSYTFSDGDRGKWFQLRSTAYEHNRRWFRILAVEGPSRIVVDAPFGLYDETSIPWAFSSSGVQTVTTNRGTYQFALTTPLRADLQDGANYRVLSFQALEALTTVFTIEDLNTAPTWWTSAQIPEAIAPGSATRRKVTAGLYPNTVRPHDGALLGDPGLYVGCDDQGRTSAVRLVDAVWYGGDTLVLALPATPTDLGQVLTVETGPLTGSFRIQTLGDNNVIPRLANFPPADAPTPPHAVVVRLPPNVLRRSVAFDLFNTALKHHCIHVAVADDPNMNGAFLLDALDLLADVRPGHNIFLTDTPTSVEDILSLEDELTVTVA